MLPSTKVAISSLDAHVSLDVSVKGSWDYPYVDFVNVSLSKIPDFNLRIVPQSERYVSKLLERCNFLHLICSNNLWTTHFIYHSGLKGVDFGSFPVVSKWVKDVINSALVDYLTPQYLSIDIPGWITGTAGEEGVFRYVGY